MISKTGEVVAICTSGDPDELPSSFWGRQGYDARAIAAFCKETASQMGVTPEQTMIVLEMGMRLGMHQKTELSKTN